MTNPFAGYHELQHTRFAAARDKDGERVASKSNRAVQWCAVGLIWKASIPSNTEGDFADFLGFCIANLNDYDLKSFRWFEARWDEFMEGRV